MNEAGAAKAAILLGKLIAALSRPGGPERVSFMAWHQQGIRYFIS